MIDTRTRVLEESTWNSELYSEFEMETLEGHFGNSELYAEFD